MINFCFLNSSYQNSSNFFVACAFFIHRIVGDDDGGTPFTPEEYEKYKKEVLPQVRA